MQPEDSLFPHPSGARISIGRWTYGYDEHTFQCWSPHDVVEIGRLTSLAAETRILGGGEHPTDLPTTYPVRACILRTPESWDAFAKGPTIIGSDVWLGYRAMVLSGVTIGDGAVIAAGSVVTRDVPAYAIASGNPARVVRSRFAPEIAERLQATRWWDWELEVLRELEPWLYADVETFLDVAERAGLAPAPRATGAGT